MSSASQDRVTNLEVYLADLSQDQPYLGSLREGESVKASGYFVRKGNRTVYPRRNRSIVVRLDSADGLTGWGETYGLVAPLATVEIIKDLFAEFVVGRDPSEPEIIYDELYDLMRVRGCSSGYYGDALAAIDIALWDLRTKRLGKSLAQFLCDAPQGEIPAYISGLPADTLEARCHLAASWQKEGFDHFKFALPVADDGAVVELSALRERLGDGAEIAIDLHWSLSAGEAIALAKELRSRRPWFLEAPVAAEDIDGLEEVARNSGQQIAAGEEWHNAWEAQHRLSRNACHMVQPEMGHTGVTQFLRIARLAEEAGIPVIPHATIGTGLFLAASLQVSRALPGFISHEFQHSIFNHFRHFTGDALRCEQGDYRISDAPGIGVEPSDEMLSALTPV